MREIWRPFYAFGSLGVASVLVGLPGMIDGSSTARDVTLFAVILLLGLATARTLIWRLIPARVTVTYDESGLFVRRGGELLRHYPWAGMRHVDLIRGYRWPEWSRWAMFAHVQVAGEGDDVEWESSPQLLVVQPRYVEEAERRLEAVARQYVNGHASR